MEFESSCQTVTAGAGVVLRSTPNSITHPTEQKIPPWVENHSVLRVLLIFANPNGTHPLRLQAEEKCIREALQQGEHGGRVVVDVLAACTIDELARKLMSSTYEIIHFSGHADRTATLLKHIVEVLQRDYLVHQSSFQNTNVKSYLAGIVESLVQELESQLLRCINSGENSSNSTHIYHGDFTKTISFNNEQALSSRHFSDSTHSNFDFQIPLTITELPVIVKDQSEGKVSETVSLSITRQYTFQELVGIGVGSLAFESESGGVNFMCPLSFAKLVSETCPPLQCVILNACAGHIQAEILSRVIPMTVCFTGRVSDKESIMFSKGFYESIACGRAIDDAFRDGSRRVEIHSLSNGIPNRHGPGVNKLCNLSNGVPLMTLIRNAELMDRIICPQSEGNIVTPSPHYDRIMKHRLEQLEKENKLLVSENSELKSLIQYGMNLLKSKDQTVSELKDTLGEILLTLKPKSNPKRVSQNGGLPGKRTPVDSRKVRFSQEKAPSKNRNLKYVHVKSSGYGKRTVQISQPGPKQSPLQQPTASPSRIPISPANRDKREYPKSDLEVRKSSSVSVFDTNQGLLPSSAPPTIKFRPKQAPSSSQIPVLKSRSLSTHEPSVVIKPTAWSKSYQNLNYDETVKIEKLESPERKSTQSTKDCNRSSAGWREFLRERREAASRLKPSSSFASSVPRFDLNNTSSIDSLL